ncbi:hypothetical protein ACJX0J_035420, partial [Zea mays]
ALNYLLLASESTSIESHVKLENKVVTKLHREIFLTRLIFLPSSPFSLQELATHETWDNIRVPLACHIYNKIERSDVSSMFYFILYNFHHGDHIEDSS